ncbi:MAG: HAD-IIB family hydrolase [Erythrobacter sp.]|nr:HAD-IIB family hydrolase [Erythrobacter sp.]
MHILSIALGGCLRSEPVSYGITEDTGGHITYILGEMAALAGHPRVTRAEIVTRLFDEPALGAIHAQEREPVAPGLTITRIDSGNRRYLAKDDLHADRPAFTRALIAELRGRDRLPDLIHAHFADAAAVAAEIESTLGIPFVYTAHSLGLDKRDAMASPCPAIEARIAEEDRAIANAAAIVGSSRDECERQLVAYPSARLERIHRIIPGISLEPATEEAIAGAQELIAPFLRDASKPVVLAIARAVRKKNLATLVEAFAEIADRANLVILAGQRSASDTGEAEQVEVIGELLHLIDRHDLYGRLAYPKRHSRADVAGLYALAARSKGVFVNPALMEPYGLTVVEAAAHGLPVVATKVGGPLDTIDELQHGTLVDPRDTAEIAAAIADLLSDRAKWEECSANGRSRSRTQCWARYADSFVKVAGEVLGTARTIAGRTGPLVDTLFVSDLDNTLTGCAQGVGRLREFLQSKPDFAFVIATGRSIIEARRIVREWDIPEPAAWITSVGSEIYWSGANGPIRDAGFPALAHARWQPDEIERIVARFGRIQPQPEYEQRDWKRSYFYTCDRDVAELRAALREAGLAVRVIASHGRLLDVLPISAGKAAAMHFVSAKLRIAPERVFAAGDSGNDEDMLIACQNAIIVRNHSAEIAKLAQRANVYTARRAHAAGAIEGLEAHSRRRASALLEYSTGEAG